MTSPIESTYGNIQMNERYKRLKRNLKMTLMKKIEQRSTDNGMNEQTTWPNLSSINGDNMDTSSVAVSLYSKNGSEVVSSSTNMKNVLSHQSQKKYLNTNNNINKDNIATSSVKNFSLTNDVTTKLMPPPKSIGILAHSSRRNLLVNGADPQINMRLDNIGMNHEYGISSSSVYSSKCPSSANAQDTLQVVFEKKMLHHTMQNNFASTEKPDRVFSKWRVMLNDKAQLIIKGTLECGKVARSKPVIRRLTAISVQSIFNHIYNLNGNIYDERNELPDYIRGKFFNGFPDDWENVYQIWCNFVAEGSNLNFRWPTPITDSDDDLKSEITEIAPLRKIGKRPGLRSKSLKDQSCSKYSPQLMTPLDRMLANEQASNCTQCQCSIASSIRNDSMNSSKILKVVNDECSRNIDTFSVDKMQHVKPNSMNANFMPCRLSNSNFISLKDVLPEDKINIILENLNSKNCSIEYIDKIFQMYDCFRYVMSYKSEAETGGESIKSTNVSSNRKAPENGNISYINSDAIFTKSCHRKTDISHSSIDRSKEDKNSSDNCENISKPKAYMMRGSKRKQKVCRRLSKNDYYSSDSNENDQNNSDYNRINKPSRRALRSHNQQLKYKRKSINDRKLSRRQKERLNDSDDDDYVPTKINPPSISIGSGLHDQIRSMVTHKTTDSIPYASTPQIVAINTRSALRQQSTTNLRYNRASSISTIGGFLKNYDSSVSVTEDESKIHVNKYVKLQPNNKSERKDVEKQFRSDSRNLHQYYDSSVNITEDEFLEAKRGKHGIRKQVLQESNTQSLQQVRKKSTIESNNFPNTSRSCDGKSIKINEINEVSRQESSLNYHDNKETILTDNKENQSMDTNENRIEKSYANSRETVVNEQTIAEQFLSKSISPEKKKKLSIVEIENISIKIKPKLMMKSQSQELESMNKEKNEFPTSENLRSSKSLDDEKKTVNTVKELSSTAGEMKFIPKSKSLTIKLHDIKDTAKGNRPMESKGEKIDKKKGVFGSENNPKRLTAWVPKVLQKSGTDYGLIFEGKLLNEANHVVNRKFATDFIATRISLKTVKTESNEFYQLIGNLSDTKHTMPKELQKLCFNGCPSKITQFCEKWKKLVLDSSNSSGQLLNISKNIQNMPVSSRGRRILPPLCYWKGERVTLRDNQVVYSPGNSQSSSFLSAEISQRDDTQNSSKRRDTSVKDTTVSTNKNSSVDIKYKRRNFATIEGKKQKNTSSNVLERMKSDHEIRMKKTLNLGDSKNQRHNHQLASIKRTLSRHLSPHSSDSMSDDNKPSKPKRRRAKINNSITNLEIENKLRTQHRKELKRSPHQPNVYHINIEDREKRKRKLSSQQNNQYDKNEVADVQGVITYKYKKRIDRESDLSDDQVSNI